MLSFYFLFCLEINLTYCVEIPERNPSDEENIGDIVTVNAGYLDFFVFFRMFPFYELEKNIFLKLKYLSLMLLLFIVTEKVLGFIALLVTTCICSQST